MMPQVTVLMPVYNTAPYLREAIDSILNQTFADFEFLIIDDASTDGSIEIVKSYDDPRIRFFEKPGNTGYTNSLNMGLETARGEYIARMDSDDISLPERLAKQVSFMNAHPEVGMCGSWIQTFDKTSLKIIQYPISHECISSKLFFSNQFAHPSVFIRKKIILEKNLSYDYQMEPTEDYDLWVRLARLTCLANLPEVLVLYRSHQKQVSFSKKNTQANKCQEISFKQLAELGVISNDAEKQLHVKLLDHSLPATAKNLCQVYSWLQKITNANTTANLFDSSIFHIHLLSFWHSMVLRIIDFEFALLRFAFWGNFQIFIKLTTKEKITFIPKCLLRWRTRI